jgi:flagellar M-ring protein FliF
MNTSKLQDLWRNLEPRGQVALVGSAIAIVAAAVFLFSYASRPSYMTIASGVQPSQSGQITKALASAGIAYRLGVGGTSVEVPDSQSSQARVALAEKNLIGGGHVGFELFDKSTLGATDFQQQVNYQRALEGEIANTIEQIQGVGSADVQLVLPQETLFADQGSQASAAVLLSGATQIDPATVAGIAHLVASSTKGLEAQHVTITDDTGTLLWPTGTGAGGSTATAKLQAEQSYSSQLGAQINALLVSTLGPDKAQARVHADLNVDQTTIDKVTYAKKGTPLQTQTDQEALKSKGDSGAAPAGTSSNLPAYSKAAGANSQSNYLHRTGTTQFGVDKTVEHTSIAPGTVNRLDVALLVDKSVPAGQVASLKSAVASLAGIQPTRGDTLAVSSVAFAPVPKKVTPAPAGLPVPASMVGIAKYVAIGLGTIVFLFLMRRGLKRREGEELAPEPTWLREIEASVPIAQLESTPALPRQLDAAAQRRTQVQGEVEEIIRNQPQAVAAQVSQWMKD